MFMQVYGREFLIYDMDNYTRQWYKTQLHLSDQDLKPIHVDFDMGPKRPPLQVYTVNMQTQDHSTFLF